MTRISPAIAGLLVASTLFGVGAYALADDRLAGLVRTTLALVLVVWAIALPAGTLLALAVAKTDLPGRRLVLVVCTALLVVPIYLQAGAWQAGFGLQGWYTLQSATAARAEAAPSDDGTIPIPPAPWLVGFRGAVWIHSLAALPWVVVIVALGLLTLEPELEEQALLDASAGRVLARVTLPAAASAMLIAALWVAVTVATEIAVTDLFRVRTLAEEVYTGLWIGDWTGGQPLSLWAGAVATLVLAGLALAACAALAPSAQHGTLGSRFVVPLNRGRWPAAVVVGLLLVVVVGLPVFNLAYKAGIDVRQVGDARVRAWSLSKGVEMTVTSPARYADEFGWSLLIALTAAAAVLAVAFPFAWLARRGQHWRWLALIVAALALAVPGPILGLGLATGFSRSGLPFLHYLYDRTITAPAIAQAVKALPLVILLLWHALASVPQETLDAAESEGAGWVVRVWRIAIPLRWPAILAAGLVGLVIAVGELSASILVIPPGMSTLPVRIFGLLHYGVEDHVASIALALLLATGLAGLFAAGLLSRRRGERAAAGSTGEDAG